MDEILQDRYKKLVKQMVEEGKLPRALFKYRSLSSINTYKIFINKKMYFSAPKDFNDPFDCKINASISNTDDLDQSLAKYGSNEGVMPAIENGYNINDTIGKVVNRKGICCFSKKKTVYSCGLIMQILIGEYVWSLILLKTMISLCSQ